MIIIPAIELRHPGHQGQGSPRQPRSTIHEWERLGFQRVHLVEPATRGNQVPSRRLTEEFLRDIHIDVQVAGDICSAGDIEELARAGATRVVVGSRALDEPDWAASIAAAFPDLLIVETPVHERPVRSRGALRTLPVDIRDLADDLSDLPLGGLIVTFGPEAPIEIGDLALVEDLADRLPFPVLVSGGAQTLATLRDLEFRGVNAVIIGAARLADSFDEPSLARTFTD